MEAMKLSEVRVVIVDRDVENLMKLRWLFEGCGYEKVACVETVEDALWLLRNNRVDILLCEFPQYGGGRGGFQVISAIRQEFTRLQLVLFSDDDVMGEMAAISAMEVGACAFYRKSMISMEVVRHHLKIIESSSSSSCINDEIMEERPNSEQVMKLEKKKRKRGDDDEEILMSSSSSSCSGELSIRSGFINISSKRVMAAAAAASKQKKKNTLLIRLNNNNTAAAAAAGSVSDHQEEAELEEMMTPPTPSANSVNSNSSIHYDYYNTVLQDWNAAAAAEDDSSSMPMLQDYWSDADIEELIILDNIPQLLHLGSLF